MPTSADFGLYDSRASLLLCLALSMAEAEVGKEVHISPKLLYLTAMVAKVDKHNKAKKLPPTT